MGSGIVCPKRLLGKEDVSQALASDWFRAAHGRKGAFADAIGAKCTKTVDRVITGEHLPALHTALNSLVADETALFNTLRLAGGVFVRAETGSCDDNETISAMLRAATDYFERMKDGKRDHQDTLALADLFRPLVPAMLCVIQEANTIKGDS